MRSAASSANGNLERLDSKAHAIRLSQLPAVPTRGESDRIVTIIITPPIATMLIAIRTAIGRWVPKRTKHDNSRNINTHSQIRVCLCRNTSSRNCKSSTHRNE